MSERVPIESGPADRGLGGVSAEQVHPEGALPAALDLSRQFMPEGLSGVAPLRALDGGERLRLNQIRAASYLHMFANFEDLLARALQHRARVRAHGLLEPLGLRSVFEEHESFGAFENAFDAAFPVRPRKITEFDDFARTLENVSALSLLVLALHLKLVTQQHYLACVRSDEALEPHFVDLLKEHWTIECGTAGRSDGAAAAIERALASSGPARVPGGLRDYRLLVFACDDVLRRQAVFDADTIEDVRAARLGEVERANIVGVQTDAHRKTFLTLGIVNAAFVYATRSLGPSAPATLAGVVSALASRP